VRILLAIPWAYTDPTSGAARSLRTMLRWLAAAGSACHVLCTARFDAADVTPAERIEALCGPQAGEGPALHFEQDGVAVTMLAGCETSAVGTDRATSLRYLALLDGLLRKFVPDVLIACGGSLLTLEALRRAHHRGVTTLFTVRNHGYEDRGWFTHADHVLTCSPYLSAAYRASIGLESTGLPSPIDWSEAAVSQEGRRFVTFVNPSLHKGAALFARLAQVLAERRADIPILVVRSEADDRGLRCFAAAGLGRYPQIHTGPPTDQPADFLALTRLLLVPSVSAEPFGRVAVEAMLNGIPPLVSDRGALPDTVGGAGRVLPAPPWMTPTSSRLPDAAEVAPWVEAICELWDRPAAYAAAAKLARRTAEQLYSEVVLKPPYLDFFASLRERAPRRPSQESHDVAQSQPAFPFAQAGPPPLPADAGAAGGSSGAGHVGRR
jgi:glycosyltransferase involved in cell wall biosynthesis